MSTVVNDTTIHDLGYRRYEGACCSRRDSGQCSDWDVR